jgi:hypothetical protein
LGYLPAEFWSLLAIFRGFLVSFHAMFLPGVEFSAFPFRMHYFKSKSAILAVK